jgi:hypothetical protein
VTTYVCTTCGQRHDGPPLSYGAIAPAAWYAIPGRERESRAVMSSDQCVIDDQYFFVLGNIYIPILDSDASFSWCVWVSLSHKNFLRMTELWEVEGRESEPPYFGWLNTALPLYPDTLNLKTLVHTRPVGERPHVELEPSEHPLSIE